MVTMLVLGVVALLAIHLRAPPNLLQNNENRMAAYVEDIVANGQWLCPHDAQGRLASKPPAYAWCAAVAALAVHRVGVFALYAPSLLSALAIAGALLVGGARQCGRRAGFLSALAWLVSPALSWLMATARYDGLFSLFVLLAALSAFRAWETGRGWTWFWLAAAAATLVKGPLGLLLGGAGLLAVVWERGARERAPLRGSPVQGVLIYLLLVGGWFALARWQVGPSLVDRMVGDELIGNALGRGAADSAHHWYRPLASWIERLAPWSLAAVIGLGRAIRRPDPLASARRFERFLVVALAIGLLVFVLSPHREARLVLPLVPLGALLAGREMARWTATWPAPRFWGVLIPLVALLLGAMAFDEGVRKPKHTATRETAVLLRAAREWTEMAGDGFPLTHLDPPIPFQLALAEIRPETTAAAAADLLYGDTQAFVALRDVMRLAAYGIAPEQGFRPLATWPASGAPLLVVLGNRPRPDWNEPVACLVGTLELRLDGLRLVQASTSRVVVRPLQASGTLRITNRDAHRRDVRVRVEGRVEPARCLTLAPGEMWSATLGVEPPPP